MKINELRFGNIVGRGLKLFPDNYFKVLEVGDTMKLQQSNDCDYYSINTIEPVLLSASILEKCGFKKDRSGFTLPDKMSLSFSVTKELGYMACWEDKSLHMPYDIKYLHQLQNLYHSLTGNELNINLK